MPSPSSKRFAYFLLAFTVAYGTGSLLMKPGYALEAFGNVGQCIIQALIVVTMALNIGRSRKRGNTFWLLMSLGCFLWFVAQVVWSYYEIYLRIQVPSAYLGDLIFFLHGVPIIAAAATKPHIDLGEADHKMRLGYLDFALLLVWWVFLYAYVVGPWQFISRNELIFGFRYDFLYTVENLFVVVAFALLWMRSAHSWKKVYGHLLGASCVYSAASLIVNVAIDRKTYHSGSLYDVPLIASMAWYAYAGYVASQTELEPEPAVVTVPSENYWDSRFAALALFSMPLFALWAAMDSSVDPAIQRYRVLLTLFCMLMLTLLHSLKEDTLHRKMIALLRESRDSYDNLQRVQTDLIQAEKLASIGRLVAGAAHEINNPLTAILGYSDLLADDTSASANQRQMADKIRAQARRTKTLVSSLLTFAKQSPTVRSPLDMNTVVTSALQLRELDHESKDIQTVRDLQPDLPQISGDANQLLQMCFHIVNNAVEAMQEAHGHGTLTVSTRQEGDQIIFRCADTGPGVANPLKIFDPFYTTKEVGKGTGLGLSACYGIVHDHGGQITCENLITGGAIFIVCLPVAGKQSSETAKSASSISMML